MSQSAKPRVEIQPPKDLNLLPATNNNMFTAKPQDNNSNHGSNDAKLEVDLPCTTNDQHVLLPVSCNSHAVCLFHYSLIYLTLYFQSTFSPINLIQAYLTQISGTSAPALLV